jgi:CheY-like chemotaxis protein
MPDAVLLDWNMPVMNGIEFLRQLRTEPGGEEPIVVFCTVENRRRAHPRGAGRRRGRIHHEAVRRRDHRGEVRRGGPGMTPEDMDLLAALGRARAGLKVDVDKTYLVESRLSPLARREGFDSIEAMIAALRAKREDRLIWAVVEALTFNETSFFRDA